MTDLDNLAAVAKKLADDSKKRLQEDVEALENLLENGDLEGEDAEEARELIDHIRSM